VLIRRKILIALLCGMVSAALSMAQIAVKFTPVKSNNISTSNSGQRPYDIYTADLNNDGIPDLIQDAGDSLDRFAVSIGNGDGTFKPAVNYSYPAGGTSTPTAAMAFGDFNGDGKVDLVVAIIGTGAMAMYFGNGDGTFQAPKTNIVDFYYSGLAVWANSSIVAGDFNADGKLDLAGASGEYLNILEGNGDGTFLDISKLLAPSTITRVLTGDFNRDGHADLSYVTDCCPGTSVTVLWGHGTFGFGPLHTISFDVPGVITGTGDMDGDGSTDIIGVSPGMSNGSTAGLVKVAFGHSDGSFTFDQSALPYLGTIEGQGLAPQIVAADFNDDGRMDFALASDKAGTKSLNFFLGTSGADHFTTETVNLAQYLQQSNPVLGVFNRDSKPDVALAQFDNAADTVITTELNSSANGTWSNCPYPLRGRGIALCSPLNFSLTGFGSANSPVDFSAAAVSFGQIRKMELWVDGKKLVQQHHVWGNNAFLHYTPTFAEGHHNGAVFAADTDGTLQKLTFDFNVGAPNCDPPATEGVQICSLSSNQDLTASARVSGTIARMELWADGAKAYTAKSTNYLAARISLTKGLHKLTVVAANTAGVTWKQSVGVIVSQ